MEINQIVSVVFLALLIIFLMVAYFVEAKTRNQEHILKFLVSLSGALAAGFFTGSLTIDGSVFGLTISGGAGFAIFVFLWVGFKKSFPDGFNYGVDEGMDFQSVAKIIVSREAKGIEFNGFDQAELDAHLMSGERRTLSAHEALKSLRSLTVESNAIGKYDVLEKGQAFILTK